MIVVICLQCSIVAFGKLAYRATIEKRSVNLAVRLAVYMTLSLVVKKLSTSWDAEAGRGGGLGSMSTLSISRSWAFNSVIRVHRCCTRSDGWIDSGIL